MMPGAKSPAAVFLTPVIPARTGQGLAMRAANQLAGLLRVFEVTVLVVPCAGSAPGAERFSTSFPGAALEVLDLRGQQDPYFRVIATRTDADEQNALFARYGKPSIAAVMSGQVAAQVADAIRRTQASWVHVFRSYLLGALDEVPAAIPRSIDLDEDDASSYHSTAAVLESRGRIAEARWAKLEAAAFDRLLAQKLRHFRAVTLANAKDAVSFAQRHAGQPLGSIANSVMLPPASVLPRERSPRREGMLFVGTLGYWPNTDGLEWFMTDVLARIPGAHLRIAGAHPPRSLRAAARRGRVEFLGFVEDLSSAYRHAALTIAPMRSGGGTRLKILEAGAFGVPVVATPEAAAGLWQSIRPWGLTACTAGEFAASCRSLLADGGRSRLLGLAGRRAVAARFSSARVDSAWAAMFRRLHEGEEM
jgi:glycosyltransferase involved in cell wall biosynthesis